jgi:hypothetical protein
VVFVEIRGICKTLSALRRLTSSDLNWPSPAVLCALWVLRYLDPGQPETPSFIRRWLGDEMVTLVWIRCSPNDINDEAIRRIQATFRGAAIYIAFSPPEPSIFPGELSRTGVSK